MAKHCYKGIITIICFRHGITKAPERNFTQLQSLEMEDYYNHMTIMHYKSATKKAILAEFDYYQSHYKNDLAFTVLCNITRIY